MATPPFKYQKMFPLGKDDTQYRLLTSEYVSTAEFKGKKILVVDPRGLAELARNAMRDVSFFLRPAHLKLVAKILEDPQASENDKSVALTMLRNAEVAAMGKLPFCQDTGTATIIGKKGHPEVLALCGARREAAVVSSPEDVRNLSPGSYKAVLQTTFPSPSPILEEAERQGVRIELLNAIAKLNHQGCKGLVIDLRENTGGYLEAAVNMLNEFLQLNSCKRME